MIGAGGFTDLHISRPFKSFLDETGPTYSALDSDQQPPPSHQDPALYAMMLDTFQAIQLNHKVALLTCGVNKFFTDSATSPKSYNLNFSAKSSFVRVHCPQVFLRTTSPRPSSPQVIANHRAHLALCAKLKGEGDIVCNQRYIFHASHQSKTTM